MIKKLWGGRFSKKTDPLVEEFTRSIQYDYKLALYDLIGSMAHVQILRRAGYLTSDEAVKLQEALNFLYENVKNGTFKPDLGSEDIHTNIQNMLHKKVDDLALKLHTARSRNEQVVFAAKLYCKAALSELDFGISRLTRALAEVSDRYKDLIIPGFTHLQHAQPVYLKDHFGAYSKMLKRDSSRLEYTFKNIKLTLGAGSLAGTPIAASNYVLTVAKFIKEKDSFWKNLHIAVTANSMDAVSDRDFMLEILGEQAVLGMHLSRLAEDLIIWSTKEFDFVEIDESFCTGSSLMPQKKNADVLELVRGYTGRLYGNLLSVLTTMKALPLAYNRDMQLDKEPLFNSLEIVSLELKVLYGLVRTLKFNESKIKEHLRDESLYATDLLYYLVDKRVPFTTAHAIIGKLVKHSIARGVEIKHMPENELRRFSDKFVKKEIIRLFDPEVSVRSKRSVKR